MERFAAALLTAMAALAVACVAASPVLRALVPGNAWPGRLLAWGRDAIVLAPLVALSGVALRAFTQQRRLGWFALGALVVTLVGMGLAR